MADRAYSASKWRGANCSEDVSDGEGKLSGDDTFETFSILVLDCTREILLLTQQLFRELRVDIGRSG